MNDQPRTPVHAILDGTSTGPIPPETEAALRPYRNTLALLDRSRALAPPGLADRIMGRLPAKRRLAWRPAPRPWLVPALAGAVAGAVVLLGWFWLAPAPPPAAAHLVKVQFELHAPEAHRVELVGSFNHWRPGSIHLEGPDASGHWTATVELAEGRYEYTFLVNGKEWVADPSAAAVRPDGFGRVNAVLEVSGEGTVL